MSSAALSFPPPAPTALAGLYDGLDDPEVAQFLAIHSPLVPVLVAAVPEVRRIFGEDARLLLIPQVEYGGAISLYAFVVLDLPQEELDRRLQRFDHEWWLDQDRHGAALIFDTGRPQ